MAAWRKEEDATRLCQEKSVTREGEESCCRARKRRACDTTSLASLTNESRETPYGHQTDRDRSINNSV